MLVPLVGVDLRFNFFLIMNWFSWSIWIREIILHCQISYNSPPDGVTALFPVLLFKFKHGIYDNGISQIATCCIGGRYYIHKSVEHGKKNTNVKIKVTYCL